MAACVGTKELVAGVPHWLRLRTPARDTVLCPLVAYPTYEMGAILAGCRAVAVPTRPDGTMELSSISPDDAARALCLWVNSPGNPAGQLEDLEAVARWGRSHGVPVFSDECYVEFTWAGPARTILEHGPRWRRRGPLAVETVEPRWAAGRLLTPATPISSGTCRALRQHAGFMVPGPCSTPVPWRSATTRTSKRQRAMYLERLERVCRGAERCRDRGRHPRRVFLPLGGRSRGSRAVQAGGELNPAWALTRWLAVHGGVLVAPGDTYGPAGAGHVRVAMVQPDDRLELVARRLAGREGSRASSALELADRGVRARARRTDNLEPMDDLSSAVGRAVGAPRAALAR